MISQALDKMTKHSFKTQRNNQGSFKRSMYCYKISEHSHGERFLIWNRNRQTLDINGNSNTQSIGEEPQRKSAESNRSSILEWVYPLDHSEENDPNIDRNSQATKSVSFEGSSPKRSSRTSSLPNVVCSSTSKKPSLSPVQSSIFRYLVSVFGHFVSFFMKGGISAMVFVFELILGFFMHVFEILNIPGSTTLKAIVNAFVFLSTMLLWGLYSAVELLFVLPVKLQLPYIVLLILVYYYSPLFLKDFIQYLLWAATRTFRYFKSFIF